MTEQTSRERFEAHPYIKGTYSFDLYGGSKDVYRDSDTSDAWLGWCAAEAGMQSRIDELEVLLKKARDYLHGEGTYTNIVNEIDAALSNKEPLKWKSLGSGEYDTTYSCPKCFKKYSVQAEDIRNELACECGFNARLY